MNKELFWKQPKFQGKQMFHYKDNIWFVRDLSGSGTGDITIMKVEESEERNGGIGTGVFFAEIEYEITIDKFSFASAVACMSKNTLNQGEYYKQVISILNGETP